MTKLQKRKESLDAIEKAMEKQSKTFEREGFTAFNCYLIPYDERILFENIFQITEEPPHSTFNEKYLNSEGRCATEAELFNLRMNAFALMYELVRQGFVAEDFERP
jgi:hypothetical protein